MSILSPNIFKHSNVAMRAAFFLHALTFLTNRGLPLVASLLVATILGPGEFGIFAVAVSAFAAVLLLADTGLSLATTSRVASENRQGVNRADHAMLISTLLCSALGLIVGVILAANSDAVSALVFGTSKYGSIVLAGSIYVPASALALVLQGAFAGMQRYGVTAAVGIVAGGAYLTAVVGCAYAGNGTTAVWGAALGALIRCLLLIGVSFRRLLHAALVLKASTVLSEIRALLQLALPALLASLVFAPIMTFLVASVGRHPSGPREAGGLAISLQLFSIVSILPSMITQFSLPWFSSAREVSEEIRHVVIFSAISLVSAVLPGIVVIVFSEKILSAVGSGYASYNVTLQIMMVAAMFSASQGVFSNYLIASGRGWVRAMSFYGWAAFAVTAFLVIGGGTAESAAGAYASAYLFLVIFQLGAVCYDFGHRRSRDQIVSSHGGSESGSDFATADHARRHSP